MYIVCPNFQHVSQPILETIDKVWSLTFFIAFNDRSTALVFTVKVFLVLPKAKNAFQHRALMVEMLLIYESQIFSSDVN